MAAMCNRFAKRKYFSRSEDGCYETYETNVKWDTGNLRSVAVEEVTFYLSPFTFHLSRFASGFSVRLLYSAPSAWEDF